MNIKKEKTASKKDIQLCICFYAGASEAVGHDQITVTVPEDYSLIQAIQSGVKVNIDNILTVCSFLVAGVLHSRETLVKDLPDFQIDVLPPFAGG